MGKAVAVGLVGLFGALAIALEHRLFGTLELTLGETVLVGAEDLGEDSLGGLLDAVLLRSALTHKGITTAT